MGRSSVRVTNFNASFQGQTQYPLGQILYIGLIITTFDSNNQTGFHQVKLTNTLLILFSFSKEIRVKL